FERKRGRIRARDSCPPLLQSPYLRLGPRIEGRPRRDGGDPKTVEGVSFPCSRGPRGRGRRPTGRTEEESMARTHRRDSFARRKSSRVGMLGALALLGARIAPSLFGLEEPSGILIYGPP